MTHLYNQPIVVTLTGGKPEMIRWRAVTYKVAQVNEPWHQTDPRRQPGGTGARGSGRRGSFRTYYRVQRISATGEDLTCDIYVEAVNGVWMLERIYD